MYKIKNQTFHKLPLEATEQKALVVWLNENNIFFFAIPNGGTRNAREVKNMKLEGLLTGASDLVIFLNDIILFIELKRQRPVLKSGKLGAPKYKPSEDQLEFLAKVNCFKYAIGVVAYGCDEAINIVREYL